MANICNDQYRFTNTGHLAAILWNSVAEQYLAESAYVS